MTWGKSIPIEDVGGKKNLDKNQTSASSYSRGVIGLLWQIKVGGGGERRWGGRGGVLPLGKKERGRGGGASMIKIEEEDWDQKIKAKATLALPGQGKGQEWLIANFKEEVVVAVAAEAAAVVEVEAVRGGEGKRG